MKRKPFLQRSASAIMVGISQILKQIGKLGIVSELLDNKDVFISTAGKILAFSGYSIFRAISNCEFKTIYTTSSLNKIKDTDSMIYSDGIIFI